MWQGLLKLSLLLVISGCTMNKEYKLEYYDYPAECWADEIKICEGNTPRNLECNCYSSIVENTT